MITRESGLGFVSNNAVDRTVIVTKLRKLRLNRAYGRIISVLIRVNIGRLVIVVVRGIVVVIVRVIVIIVRVITVGVVRIVIPWVKSPPESVDEDKDDIIMKVGAMLVPIAMPVGIMTRKRVVPDE